MSAAIELVNPVRFIQATRDSGYRHIASALSELVDNSMQAGASEVDILVEEDSEGIPFVAILDDGCGMNRNQLSSALQFGGSDRFDDRSGMGRFGMGLPNSSLSQARRVDVYSWRNPKFVWHSYLDIDEILGAVRPALDVPKRSVLPEGFKGRVQQTGTLVIWRTLDRVKVVNWNLMAKRLAHRLGQIFRYFLWEGRTVRINGHAITPHDPLFLSSRTRTPWVKAEQYGEALEYQITVGEAGPGQTPSVVRVRFSELPIRTLSPLSNHDKRLHGISNGAGVSIVRAGREIDYGWFLMDKRRENYDDWWRCEICFSPDLDEMFGVTHIKQGIRPSEQLCGIMTAELGSIARALNRRVRLAHIALAAEQGTQAAAIVASERDTLLRPINALSPLDVSPEATDGKLKYCLTSDKIDDRLFCRTRAEDGQVQITLNTQHEFYLNVYRPLLESTCDQTHAHRKQLELLLFALARSVYLDRDDRDQSVIQQFLTDWSRAISVFCGGVPYGS